ncbi:winged helix-turn-helix domain-containing protein [Candidatus Woesearchaeota archaeon]|nr:winged helix-turn-helix domain-containing protein [Candidatus Woesearchaeota archaeon]
MAFIHQKITIVKIRKPTEKNVNDDLQFLGNSLGLFNLRDKDKSCFRVFIELLKAAKRRQPISSDELAYRLGLTRGTVVHHINKLMEAGIVVHEGKRYFLRVDKLEALIQEIRKDLMRTCDDLQGIAQEIDKELRL